ncbi:MAG: ABC transporter ATP-binding protein [Endomicrobium sp.]|jgi:lipoprotein-releasing system ATP-binding protein|nr:ABC transporter ATP-binding protein [Endomicrobium sp.]
MNLIVKNLSKSYKKMKFLEIEILKNIQLRIKSGQKLALTGPSGAGKSTLIHILGLMDKPTIGKVYINGVDCFSKNDKYLCSMRRENIGFMFQFHYLMTDFTVLENILIPVWSIRNIKLEHARNILKKIGLIHRQDHYINELSGGEQQRVALARALINNPKIVFADEPTGNLDTNTGIEIEDLLFESISELKATLIFVTHNEKLAAKADKVIKMLDGKIIEGECDESLY